MCLVRGLIPRFVAILMLPSLSQKIVIGFVIFRAKSLESLSSQADYLDAIDKSMYSASNEERVTLACFFDSQVIGLVPILNTKPIVD